MRSKFAPNQLSHASINAFSRTRALYGAHKMTGDKADKDRAWMVGALNEEERVEHGESEHSEAATEGEGSPSLGKPKSSSRKPSKPTE
ncbi:MAG: hypothetical protein ACYDD1_00070 [Caulobacteraceae bacterium]